MAKRSRAGWMKALKELAVSGLSVNEFAGQKGGCPATIYRWKALLRDQGVHRQPAAVRTEQPRLLPVEVVASPPTLDLGVRVNRGPGLAIEVSVLPGVTLVAIVRNQWNMDPFEGSLSAFLGKRGDRLKMLFGQRGGFVLYYKRLETGHFRMPKVTTSASQVQIDGTVLAMLLDGIDVARAPRLELWDPHGVAAGELPQGK